MISTTWLHIRCSTQFNTQWSVFRVCCFIFIVTDRFVYLVWLKGLLLYSQHILVTYWWKSVKANENEIKCARAIKQIDLHIQKHLQNVWLYWLFSSPITHSHIISSNKFAPDELDWFSTSTDVYIFEKGKFYCIDI